MQHGRCPLIGDRADQFVTSFASPWFVQGNAGPVVHSLACTPRVQAVNVQQAKP